MPQQIAPISLLERLAVLEEQVAVLRRTGWQRAELPFYPTSADSMPYDDSTTLLTMWETILTPRTATLSLGLVMIGDQVSGTNTGGEYAVVVNDTTTVMSGVVTATYSYQFAAGVIDLTPYRGTAQLKVQIKVRRTNGATTGGRFGGGGAIAIAPRYAQLL
ncbi:hypothetical protein ACIQJW_26885 [Streptomyces californicus]|uniref:hypothetical protein n=1 Tax=Streptomyces californicus TaxID=67351 RepID=UPI00380042F8